MGEEQRCPHPRRPSANGPVGSWPVARRTGRIVGSIYPAATLGFVMDRQPHRTGDRSQGPQHLIDLSVVVTGRASRPNFGVLVDTHGRRPAATSALAVLIIAHRRWFPWKKVRLIESDTPVGSS